MYDAQNTPKMFLRLLLILALAGCDPAMYFQGDGVPEKDAQSAAENRKTAELNRQAADNGYIPAQINLGNMYANGRGVPKDDAQAVFGYRKAAEPWDLAVRNEVGFYYPKGHRAPANGSQGMSRGDAFAQNNLGFMYASGRGVPRDDVQAVFWYRKAAEQEQGNLVAWMNLGLMYEQGRGVPKDDAQASEWYRKAVESYRKAWERVKPNQDFAVALLYDLGSRYEEGRSVPKDSAQAIVWYRKAAEQGNTLAKEKLRALEDAQHQ